MVDNTPTGLCSFAIYGCTNSVANNYVVEATEENAAALNIAIESAMERYIAATAMGDAAVPCAAAFHLWQALFTSSSTYSMMVAPECLANAYRKP